MFLVIVMLKERDDLIKKIKSGKKIAKKEIVGIQIDVEQIIKEKSPDEKHIEHTLDNLLNLIVLGIGIKEFHELNDFYFTINSQNAEDYKIIYEEMFEKKY